MEKRRRMAMLIVLTRYTRWLVNRGVIKTAGQGDHLISTYLKDLSNDLGERQKQRETAEGPVS